METTKRRRLNEVLLVLGVSLGQSAVYSIVSLTAKLTSGRSLAAQSTTLNPSQASGRPWLDLTLQLAGIVFGLVPALLALHLLGDAESGTARVGLRPRRLRFDLFSGVGLAAAIGIPGLGLYFVSRFLGLNTTVVPEALPAAWWTIPVLLLTAVQDGVLEEVVAVGYLTTRLRELGWPVLWTVSASALLRGSYHLYQGFGGFLGNLVMGVVFAVFFVRVRRVGPLIVAHALLDSFAFVGYLLLQDHWKWLH